MQGFSVLSLYLCPILSRFHAKGWGRAERTNLIFGESPAKDIASRL
ncbi:hypothetical protein AciPR4_0454 [Terriglobus saanensis SP1PR4]|uniref:Uncharacterized protein n=1 Tax=Terriglobus saanensis (strain ATCC BAA-1853 / DSM 23119 / SP1PR4) TaxID=401053 RepID=E8V314_TERSS|nr:hypothetical protein AciPR4_0454 [Terriglobus saanensis SP1PR4]